MRKGLIATLAFLLVGVVISPAQASESEFKVMTRNLYLGADVAIAMELLPDFPAATQFMWDQMRQTDFEKRSKLFVQEIKTEDPDVIGLQEAAKWYCKAGIFSKPVTVFDFVEILISDLSSAGLNYEIATSGKNQAVNVGFEIAPIPLLTSAQEYALFQSLFGQPSAYCGFEIADVLLVKKSLSREILAVGTSEYEAKYTIIPTVMSIYRGYSWADININQKPIRFVTTHLESSFSPDKKPVAKIQADQLIEDLANTKIPIVLLGDFNSDPRDPRGGESLNPGLQPSDNESCLAQVSNPSGSSALGGCNAYWTIVQNEFIDAGPDALDPTNYTWGLSALLTGPDSARAGAAKQLGNAAGFTDRLDYIFTKGEIQTTEVKIIGNSVIGPWASDHAGLVATLDVGSMAYSINYNENPLPEHKKFPLGFWDVFLLGTVTLVSLLLVRRQKRLKAREKPELSHRYS